MCIRDRIKEFAVEKVRYALDTNDKNIREERLAPIVDEIHEKFDERCEEGKTGVIDECIYKLQKFVVRRWLLDDGKRVDGRKLDEIRPLDAEVALLPRVHGSALFTLSLIHIYRHSAQRPSAVFCLGG